MSVIFILIAFSIVLAGLFLVAFIYFVRSGELDDTYTPSVRMLLDDFETEKKNEKESKNSSNKKIDKSHKAK